jgi:archaellin
MRTRIGRCLLNQIGDQRKHIHMTVGTTPQSERQQGITGLETAIILIAFMFIVSAFAFTVLSTGIFSPERSKDTAYAGLSEARSSLVTRGSFGGLAGKVSTTEAPYKFSFVVASAIGSSDPIDLTPPYTATIPGQTRTSFRGLHTGSRFNYPDINNFLYDIPRTVSFIGNSNSENLLDDDEKAEATGWILDRNTQTAIGSNRSRVHGRIWRWWWRRRHDKLRHGADHQR